jgi:hypothetical protein
MARWASTMWGDVVEERGMQSSEQRREEGADGV